MNYDYEVLIVGGGPAGLSAALTLARIHRTALICDDGQPRNAPSSHMNNFPGYDGVHPEFWREQVQKDLKKYPSIQNFKGSVLNLKKHESYFLAELSGGRQVKIKKVILAYGIKDKMLPIDGFEEMWGKAIFHCPFCHGYEIMGSKLGLLIKNEMALHSFPLIHSLSNDLTLFFDGEVVLSDEQLESLKKKNLPIKIHKVVKIHSNDNKLKSLELEDGKKITIDYLFYAAKFPFQTSSELGQSFGCKTNSFGLYEVNDFGATTVPGVFACGDNMQMMQSVLLACASGVKAGASAISELLHDI